MSTLTPQKLLKQWQLEKITVGMAISHILQNLVKMQTAIAATNITLYNLRADIDSLIAHTGMKPDSKDRKRRPKKG